MFNRGLMLQRRHILQLAVACTVLSASPTMGAEPHKIAMLGTGKVGQALGSVWVKAGHQVMFSSRNPDGLKAFAAGLGPSARVGTVAEAVAFADVIVLAVPYGALPQLGNDHAAAWAGKALVMDTCNPFESRDGAVATAALAKGAGVYSAELLPGARIVRAFNAVPAARMSAGGTGAKGQPLGMPIGGDDPGALAIASALVRDTGFEPVVAGSLAFSRYLMPRTPMAGEMTVDEIKRVAATLAP